MSFKSKDLHFEAEQPAFLRRLRGQVTGATDDPHRHVRPVALPKKAKQDDQDDAPTYVLEGSDATISKEEYDTLTGSKSTDQAGQNDTAEDASSEALGPKLPQEGSAAQGDATTKKQKMADVGMNSKKRKAVKIVGEDPEEEDGTADQKTAAPVSSGVKKSKKKAKAIKLSFGDDEER
jgi:hypothetical protein